MNDQKLRVFNWAWLHGVLDVKEFDSLRAAADTAYANCWADSEALECIEVFVDGEHTVHDHWTAWDFVRAHRTPDLAPVQVMDLTPAWAVSVQCPTDKDARAEVESVASEDALPEALERWRAVFGEDRVSWGRRENGSGGLA